MIGDCRPPRNNETPECDGGTAATVASGIVLPFNAGMIRKHRTMIAAAALAASTLSALAGQWESEWSRASRSEARLVASGGLVDGRYRAAVEIRLEGDAVTYWRDPGDAGAAPVVGLDGSANLKSAALAFPSPSRFDEAGEKVNGYAHGVVLPLDVAPVDPSAPVRLKLSLTYAVCDRVCMLVDATATLDLGPGASGPQAARIAEARARTPKPAGLAGVAVVASRPRTEGKPTWLLKPKQGVVEDVFVEAEDGFGFAVERSDAGFRIVETSHPRGREAPGAVTLTLTGPSPVEVKATLPGAE
jgi:DsbC/DsbD-like thiol-disulfide interchange protein